MLLFWAEMFYKLLKQNTEKLLDNVQKTWSQRWSKFFFFMFPQDKDLHIERWDSQAYGRHNGTVMGT